MKVTTFTARPENATVKLVEGVRLKCPDLAISSPVERTKVGKSGVIWGIPGKTDRECQP
jgi:hypothetical protein